MVEYENKMATTTVKDVVAAIIPEPNPEVKFYRGCLLYTSDAADE